MAAPTGTGVEIARLARRATRKRKIGFFGFIGASLAAFFVGILVACVAGAIGTTIVDSFFRGF